MKKLLIVALVLILGLALLVGCQQPKPADQPGDAPKPPAQPGEAPTDKPGEPPAPPAEGADQIPYLHGVVVMGSVDKEAKGADCKEFAEMKFPGDVKVIALKIDKNPEAPKGKDVEVAFFFQDKKEPVKKHVIKSDMLIEGEQFLLLNPEKDAFVPGPYRVEIMEVGTPDKKNSIGFSVEGGAPGDMKPGEPAPAPAPGDAKPGDAPPAPGDGAPAPGDVKAPAPGDAAPAPGDAAPAPGEEKKDEPKEEGDK